MGKGRKEKDPALPGRYKFEDPDDVMSRHAHMITSKLALPASRCLMYILSPSLSLALLHSSPIITTTGPLSALKPHIQIRKHDSRSHHQCVEQTDNHFANEIVSRSGPRYCSRQINQLYRKSPIQKHVVVFPSPPIYQRRVPVKLHSNPRRMFRCHSIFFASSVSSTSCDNQTTYDFKPQPKPLLQKPRCMAQTHLIVMI